MKYASEIGSFRREYFYENNLNAITLMSKEGFVFDRDYDANKNKILEKVMKNYELAEEKRKMVAGLNTEDISNAIKLFIRSYTGEKAIYKFTQF